MTDIIQVPSTGRRRHTATLFSRLIAYIRLRRRRHSHSVERIPAYLQRDIGIDPLHRRLKNLPYY